MNHRYEVESMKRSDVRSQMSKIVDEVLRALRGRLIDEIKGAYCPKCGSLIYSSLSNTWAGNHVPYYSIEGGRIEVGYRCPKSDNPVVIYRISLDAFIKALEGGEEGTKYLE